MEETLLYYMLYEGIYWAFSLKEVVKRTLQTGNEKMLPRDSGGYISTITVLHLRALSTLN